MKKVLIIIGLMLGVGLLTGGIVKAVPPCKSYFTNIFGYSVQERCTPPVEKTGYCNLGEKSCSKKISKQSVYKFTCEGKSTRNGISECGNGMPGAVPRTGEMMSVGDPGCDKTVQIDVFQKECMVANRWICDGKSVAAGGDMLDFFVYYNDDCPPPACNTDDVKMEVSPNPVEADSPVSFIIGGDASLYIGDNYGGGANGCSKSDLWYNKTCTSSKTAKTYTWTHTWKLCRFDDPSRCSPKCENSVEYEVVSPRVLSPKSCSVSVGSTLPVGELIAIVASGEGNMGVVDNRPEPVRLWLERADGGPINPLPAEVTRTYASALGTTTYQINECTSTNDQPCNLSKNISSGLAPGAYFLHCDLTTDPQSPIELGTGKCSGNPFCQLGLTPPRASGDARALVTRREACTDWVYCNAIGRQDRDYFTVTEPKPVGVGITIRNSGNTIVPVETGDKNQICQTIFKSAGVHDRKVKFSVTVSDASGGETINKVSLRLRRGGTTIMQVNGIGLTTMAPTYSVTVGGVSLYETSTKSVSGDKLTVTFPIQFPETFGAPFAVDSLQIWAEDETKQSSEWTDNGRKFKVWNCKVPVSGIVYDGSDAPLGPVCPTDGYSTPVEADIFKSLTYVNLVSGSKIMTIVGASNYAGSGDKSLIWGGGSYAAKFNGEDGLPGSAPIAKLGDKKKSPVPYTCPVTVAAISISQTEIDAYQGQPEATVDFSFTANQGPWYQTVSGGRLGAGAIQSMVPPTCKALGGCTPALSMDSDSGTNGVVIAGGGISNIAGCSDSDCKNGFPNDWYRKNKNITDGSISYEGLKTLYYDRKGIGKVVSGGNWSLVKSVAEANKVIFVDGNLTIDANNTVLPGDFLMVVVKELVIVNETVTKFDGIIVTDGMVKAIGEDANTLNLNGSIYARGGFVNERSLGGGDENNETPSVKVNYRPDFIFSMPAKLAENVYNWREGN